MLCNLSCALRLALPVFSLCFARPEYMCIYICIYRDRDREGERERENSLRLTAPAIIPAITILLVMTGTFLLHVYESAGVF